MDSKAREMGNYKKVNITEDNLNTNKALNKIINPGTISN